MAHSSNVLPTAFFLCSHCSFPSDSTPLSLHRSPIYLQSSSSTPVEACEHLRGRLGSLPMLSSFSGWGQEPHFPPNLTTCTRQVVAGNPLDASFPPNLRAETSKRCRKCAHGGREERRRGRRSWRGRSFGVHEFTAFGVLAERSPSCVSSCSCHAGPLQEMDAETSA